MNKGLVGLMALGALGLAACGSTYCQSGPRNGTQCYTATDGFVHDPPNPPAENPADLSGPGSAPVNRTGPATPPQERSTPPERWR